MIARGWAAAPYRKGEADRAGQSACERRPDGAGAKVGCPARSAGVGETCRVSPTPTVEKRASGGAVPGAGLVTSCQGVGRGGAGVRRPIGSGEGRVLGRGQRGLCINAKSVGDRPPDQGQSATASTSVTPRYSAAIASGSPTALAEPFPCRCHRRSVQAIALTRSFPANKPGIAAIANLLERAGRYRVRQSLTRPR